MQWLVSKEPILYPEAVAIMDQRVENIYQNKSDECVWLLEHPPLYTAGTSAQVTDLLNPQFPVYKAGRGGQYTYHGPGQRVCYVMLNLTKRTKDIRHYINQLERWIALTLLKYNIVTKTYPDRVGLWVETGQGEEKIAAIGVRVRRWVTFHGISINIKPNLSHFEGIVPCGLKQYGVTSLEKLGYTVAMGDFDNVLKEQFFNVFAGNE